MRKLVNVLVVCVQFNFLTSLSVRYWFKGPKIQGSAAELSAIERSVGETVRVDVEGAAGGK